MNGFSKNEAIVEERRFDVIQEGAELEVGIAYSTLSDEELREWVESHKESCLTVVGKLGFEKISDEIVMLLL